MNSKLRIGSAVMATLVLFVATHALAQQVIPLYEGKIPNSIATPNREYENAGHFLAKVSQPSLTVFIPAAGTANGTAVIICPGGGYTSLGVHREGDSVARRFSLLGVTAFVLKYRLPDDSTMPDKSIGPLQDAQRAILIVKTRAKEWNIDTGKVGMMGFSAGGHLAATAGTHFSKALIDNPYPISLRPAFMLLVYPVISFTDSLAHQGTRTALLGTPASAAQITLFSNELQVSAATPPAFLIHGSDDEMVSVKNSLVFYQALLKNNIPAGLHIFSKGRHGFLQPPASDAWFQYCVQWMQENGWLK